MPLLTPSRIAIIVLSLSFLSFLWTRGFQYQFAEPSGPLIDHYDHKNVHSEPIIPAPIIATPTWQVIPHKPTPKENHPTGGNDVPQLAKHKTVAASKETGFQEDGVKGAVPTTLLKHATPAPNAPNATNATAQSNSPAETPSTTPGSRFCKEVHGAPHVMVVLRTSKAEIFEKLPTHIQGLLSCVPNFAIFSDHEGEIDGITVHNALANIDSEMKRTHDEFREYQIMHADAEHKPDPGRTKDLDRWKFLPMVYKAYKMKPDAKFIVFIEADTSLSWTNTLQWISRLDYRIPYYSGSPVFIDNTQLGQRGSGILLSQGALRRYAKSYDELYRSKWEKNVGEVCCGDLALARALEDSHVEFYSSWPLMQSEHPASLDYTDKHWCVPAVSWHHTSGEVLEEMWNSQKAWIAKNGWDKPFLYRDAFQMFVAPHIEPVKKEWDNMSQDTKIVAPQGRQQQLKDEEERRRKHQEDQADKKRSEEDKKEETEQKRSLFPQRESDKPKEIDWGKLAETFKDAADSAEHCEKSCEQVDDCLQWRYKANGDGECHLGKVLKLGRKTHEGDENWSSGWMMERIGKVVEEWECKEVKWRFYQ